MPSGKTFPMDKLFTTTATDWIGLSILRIGMNSDGTPHRAVRLASEGRERR